MVHEIQLGVKVLGAQSCLTLCDPMDCSPPGSSVHGILQEWIAIPSSGDLPDSGIEPWSSTLQAGSLSLSLLLLPSHFSRV